MLKSTRAWLGFLLKLGITGFLLTWLLRTHSDELRDSILARPWEMNPWWFLLGFLALGCSLTLCALRWFFFLRIQRIPISFAHAFHLTIVAHFFTLLSFGPLAGDAMRIILLARQFPNRTSAITLSVFADHLSGLIAMSVMFTVFTGAHYGKLTGAEGPLTQGAVFAAVGLLLLMVLLMIFTFVISTPKGFEIGGKFFPRLAKNNRIAAFVAAWDLFRSRWPGSVAACIISFPLLTVFFLSFYCGGRTAGVDAPVQSVLAVMPIVDVLTALPITIAGLGLREKLFADLLGILANTPPSDAIALSLTGLAFSLLWGFIGGLSLLLSPRHAKTKTTTASMTNDHP